MLRGMSSMVNAAKPSLLAGLLLAMLVCSSSVSSVSAQDFFGPNTSFGPFVSDTTLPFPATAIDGDIAVGLFAGVVAVLERNPELGTWEEIAQLTPSDGTGLFGRAVAVHGTAIVVGADASAFVYHRTTAGDWRETAKLVPSDGAAGFGYDVDVDGSHAIVGLAPGGSGIERGAYIFQRTSGSWSEVVKLVPSAGPPNERDFGQRVAISGETAMVDVTTFPGVPPNSGGSYMFERNEGGPDNWGQSRRIVGPAPHSIDVSGDTAIIAGWGPLESCEVSVYSRNRGGPNVWGRTFDPFIPGHRCGVLSRVPQVEISGDKAVYFVAVSRAASNEVVVLARNQGGPDAWGRISVFVRPPWVPPFPGPTFFGASLGGDTLFLRPGPVMVSDVDADGARDGIDPCPRDPHNNVEGGCQRASGAYPILNDSITISDVTTDTHAGEFVITATFTNTGETPIRNPFFEVTDLSGGNVLTNADGTYGGVGATLSPDVGDGVLSLAEPARVVFRLRLASFDAFTFFVNIRGTAAP